MPTFRELRRRLEWLAWAWSVLLVLMCLAGLLVGQMWGWLVTLFQGK